MMSRPPKVLFLNGFFPITHLATIYNDGSNYYFGLVLFLTLFFLFLCQAIAFQPKSLSS